MFFLSSQFVHKASFSSKSVASKILVPFKRTIDYALKPQIDFSKTKVVTLNIKHSPNPFDEIALEEAIKIKERNLGNGIENEVVVASVGRATDYTDVLRKALAMGADRAIVVDSDEEALASMRPFEIAKVLFGIVKKEEPQLVIMGKQAIDDDSGQTGSILAHLLKWPLATFASKIEFKGNGKMHVTREIERGLQTIETFLPCVITVDLRLNIPRYATLPNIMKARSKPIEKIDLSTIPDINLDSGIQVLQINEPSSKKAGRVLKDVNELMDCLIADGKLSAQ